MELFLMGLCLALLGVAVAGLGFTAASHSGAQEAADPITLKAQPATSRFFAERIVPPGPTPSRIPIEVLMGRIESHVRQEQQAAELFIAFPASDRLHTKTQSPLVN